MLTKRKFMSLLSGGVAAAALIPFAAYAAKSARVPVVEWSAGADDLVDPWIRVTDDPFDLEGTWVTETVGPIEWDGRSAVRLSWEGKWVLTQVPG